jgi:hypothetical protein
MKKSYILKILLFTQAVGVLIYTFFAFSNEGADLFSVFLTNITSMNWNGQFNLDFSCYLTLSGIWIMWRNQFSFSSILFAIIATVMGIIVFAPYVLYLVIKEKGNLKTVLIGNQEGF